MKLCPAAAALAKAAANAGQAPRAAEERCPVTGLTLSEASSKQAGAEAAERAEAKGDGTQAANAGDAAAASAPTCPYGFKSNASVASSLDPYTCAVCKSLYFECADAQPCKHSFCAGCIRRFRDCPLCGRDVEGAELNAERQRLVDGYLQAHAHEHRVEETGPFAGASGSGAEPPERIHNRAVFLLQLALRAHAAGNLEAAAARCLAARAHALELAATLASGPPRLLEQAQHELGVVCGKLGDVRAAAGDGPEAARWYRESLAALSAAGASPSASQALTVSANKLGDLLYRCGELQGAREVYGNALALRRAALAAAPPERRAEAAVDVSVSLGKLGELEAAAGRPGEAREALEEARALVGGLPPDARDSDKCRRYLAFFDEALRALGAPPTGPAAGS